MRSILVIVVGFAVGYVLGARAGRDRYEQIMSTVRTATSSAKRGRHQIVLPDRAAAPVTRPSTP